MPKALVFQADKPAAIRKAAALLKKEAVVAFPTETVYGLGADVFNPRAVAKIFEVKKRPFFDPLIVHVASPEEAFSLWKGKSKIARVLAEKFWPGPLTLVLPKTRKVSDIVTAGLATVAVRMPSHPAALALIKALGHPIAAPSANPFGYTSPTTAQAVFEDLGNSIPLILDGGPCTYGIESTVLKIENEKLILLRPGAVSVERLTDVVPWGDVSNNILEFLTSPHGTTSGVLSPGLLESHYAPYTPFLLMDGNFVKFTKEMLNLRSAYRKKKQAWPKIGLLLFEKKNTGKLFKHVEYLSKKKDLYEAASNLFQAIRKLDKMGLNLIVAEQISERGLGLAIMDRLKKAAGGRIIRHPRVLLSGII